MYFKRILAILFLGFSLVHTTAFAADAKKQFNICWTIYAGWMPWDYAQAKGIVAKWAKKYDIAIKVTQLNDYAESINQYTAGQFDGCAMANLDALIVPAAGGVDSTALIAGDYSNGNDGIVIKGSNKQLKDIKGQPVHLVQYSVSHYLLARALEQAGLRQKDVKLVNVSDADVVGAFNTPSVKSMATWNPQLSELTAMPNTTKVFDSSQIPGEIIDLMVVNTNTLQKNPALGKALTGAWFEVMQMMKAKNKDALQFMAKNSGSSYESYLQQLSTTELFYEPATALQFVRDPKLPGMMEKVAKFSFENGLLGPTAKSASAVGIAYPNGVVTGNSKNIKLRFVDTYLQMAVEGKL
jgi:NitT/TauT family transport system substrate-binding protein